MAQVRREMNREGDEGRGKASKQRAERERKRRQQEIHSSNSETFRPFEHFPHPFEQIFICFGCISSE